MGDELEWYQTSVSDFGARVHRIGADQWSAPTPDVDWDVRALVNHVVGECAWVPPLIGGSTIADVGDSLDGDLLGDDAIAAWDRHVQAALAAMGKDGALDGTVHLSYGEESAREYCRQVAFDALVHAWDLGRALGADEPLDPHAVEHALGWLTPQVRDAFSQGGMFAEAVPVPENATPQERLIALTGRDPRR